MNPTGICCHHATDRCRVSCGQIHPEHQIVRPRELVQLHQRHSRTHGDVTADRVEVLEGT